MRISLNGEWDVMGFGPQGETMALKGSVPGCVHTDLLDAGIIKDIYYRDNAGKVRWIENWNWRYTRLFTLDEVPEEAEICFEGLDTYARVFLNGYEIGQSEDMFLPYAFPAGHLIEGENRLEVVFLSPVGMTRSLPSRPGAFTTERLYTRRLQCTYSWDWVDRFVTMGIFRDVSLHAAETTEIGDLFAETAAVDQYGALLRCQVSMLKPDTALFCRLTLHDPQGREIYHKRRRVVEAQINEQIAVDDPELWWPNGYGSQPLYRLTAKIEREDGTAVDEREINLGLRTVRILQKADKPGTPYFEKCLKLKKGPHVSGEKAFWDRNGEDEFSGFTLIVNGERIFCKGANWVPCEPFPSAERPDKIRTLLEMLRDAHGNMVRVWGGGLFEQDAFYDACDRLGLLVTQDFLMACGRYPEWDDHFLDLLRLEARHAARRLRSHPCLAWWTGDNENGMDGDEDMLDYGGRRAALRAIGPELMALDPNRPFLPSSPYAGRPYGSITKGTTHNTNYIGEWFSYIRFNDMVDYRDYFDCYLSRFCAEGRISGLPSYTSLRRFLTDDDIFGEDQAMMRFHTKNNPSDAFREFEIYDYLCAISDKLLGQGQTPDDTLAKRQYIQYEWIRVTMELYRREKWFSSGMVYWMLNDCWPANGWAIIDYYTRPKAAWYGFRRASQPVIAAISKEDGEYRLTVCCDGLTAYAGEARLFIQPFDRAEPIREIRTKFDSIINESRVVLTARWAEAAPGSLLMAEVRGDGFFDRTWLFEKRPQDQSMIAPYPEARLEGERLTLKANTFIQAVILDGEGQFEDNYFCMLPGETRLIRCVRPQNEPVRLRILNSDQPTMILK